LGWRVFKKDPPRLSATMIAKSMLKMSPTTCEFLPMDEITVTGDVYADDDPAKILHYASDFAPFKPRADVLLLANAHVPGGQPARVLDVGFRVGGLSKALRVHGKRKWVAGVLSWKGSVEGEPFESLPLTYEFAHGGKKSTLNPLGTGLDGEEMARIEDPQKPITKPRTDLLPAGFMPLPAAWPQRASSVGTYDDKWLKDRWPWFPEDFDWGYFNAAPRDQQVEGYLRGDEEMEFTHLHKEHPVYRTRLPGRRPRWFVRERMKNGELDFREVPLVLDTLWIDLDKEQAVLVWRGLVEVQSMRLKEIEQMLIVSESMSEPAQSLDHHRAELDRRLAEDAVDLAPEPDDPEIAKALQELERFKAEAQAQAQAEAQAAAGAEQKARATPEPPGGSSLEEAAAVLEALVAAMIARGAPDSDPELGETRTKLAQVRELQKLQPPEAPAGRKGIEAAVARGMSFAGMDLSGRDLSGMNLAEVDLLGAILSEAKLTEANLSKANLTEAVLYKADLTGADLTGAVLVDALLIEASVAKARFAMTQLSGADLSKSNLAGCDFSNCEGKGADFSGANLSAAVFSGSKLSQAEFSGCDLQRAHFAGAELQRAMFDGVKAQQVDFAGADLTKAQSGAGADFTAGIFVKIKGNESVWEECILDRADFSGASLVRAQFASASLREAKCDKADLSAADFSDACLQRAQLTNCNLLKASFDRADLTQAELLYSNLYEAGFWEAVTDEADLSGANLKRTLLG
jgi:uncharacterized protein YjbI with pentapeptide repeats